MLLAIFARKMVALQFLIVQKLSLRKSLSTHLIGLLQVPCYCFVGEEVAQQKASSDTSLSETSRHAGQPRRDEAALQGKMDTLQSSQQGWDIFAWQPYLRIALLGLS
jgi:hypothetical protein